MLHPFTSLFESPPCIPEFSSYGYRYFKTASQTLGLLETPIIVKLTYKACSYTDKNS